MAAAAAVVVVWLFILIEEEKTRVGGEASGKAIFLAAWRGF
jgi:hypothetical protein